LSDDSQLPPVPPEPGPPENENNGSDSKADSFLEKGVTSLPIEEELKDSYLTYAMSVIVSRALPDVRDGLKPSQRRILVAMNDLNIGPSSSRVKCAKISGDTSGNYHPHGEAIVYPTLVRMAQDWNMRHVLVDKQGNFGSIAGLPPAAMRYTEARMSSAASLMLEDLKLDTVDFVPTYDEQRTEPSVLPSKFPNLLVNGANGIAVGMATSVPPHNLAEICDATIRVIQDPNVSIDELMEICPGPDFPTGGIVCGRSAIRRGYHTGRSTIVVRARARIEEWKKNRSRIVITEIPYQQTRDRIEEKIAATVTDGKIEGISNIRNESDLKEPVRLILELKRDADPDVVLNQLYRFTPLQDSISLILLALVDGKPRVLSFKQILEEYIRHRVTVIRRRTQFLLAKARRRKHTVEGLLLAHANIDEVIRVIRASKTQPEAKVRLMDIKCPSSLMRRALGDEGFAVFEGERGVAEDYSLTPVQADAILRMTLGQLVNLEQEKLSDEFNELLKEIIEYNRILSDRQIILDMICDDLREVKRKHGDARRTEISGEELGNVDLEDLINEETMVVSISSNGYIKRTPVSAYRAQRRGGKGLKGAKFDEEDPIQHLFVASTHAYLMFFTNMGKCYWLKVYNLPQLARDARGRAIINLLDLDEGETITDCRAVKDFDKPDHFLMMATRKGLIKKTSLAAYRRPMARGIIAIKIREGDELVDVVVTKPDDEVILSTKNGMAIRFNQADTRPMGRNSSGVKGISIFGDDEVVGMVVVDTDGQLLTACANGYGKRTPFGLNMSAEEAASEENEQTSTKSYRTQRRGGKGIRDIKTTKRNGPVIGSVRVYENEELLMITAFGKIQRIAAAEVSSVGRNTQGVRIMGLSKGDTLVALKRVPFEEVEETIVETDAENSVETTPEVTPESASEATPESTPESTPEVNPETPESPDNE
jgi:DNA gyrase subunit A